MVYKVLKGSILATAIEALVRYANLFLLRGRSQMTSAKISGFLTPSLPLVSILDQSIVLKSRNLPYCVRIWVTPSLPLSADVICECPLPLISIYF